MTNYLRAFYYLNRMRSRAYWKASRLEEYQNRRLRKIVEYVYDHVRFYRKKFDKHGIKPSDINKKDDLNKLPIIRKEEIKRNQKEIISDEFSLNDLTMLSTSGSTGEPLSIYLSDAEIEFRKAKHLRANISCGQKPWDRWVTITGPHHFGKTTKLQRMLGLYVPITVSVFNDIPTQISMLEELRPDVLDGYSSSLLLLAKELEKRKTETIKPRFVIGGAELADDYSRKYVSEVLHAPFFDQYSSVEFERMAWQCPARLEYHIDADGIILQFVDNNGEEVSAGERGEIICTSLFNYAMPFIRYAIGDIGIPSDDTCDCGRTLPLMKMVEGRKDSLLFLPDGRMLTPRAFTFAIHEFKFYNHIEKFRVIQKKLDTFEFRIVMKNNSLDEDVVEAALLAHIRTTLRLDGIRFNVKFVKDIPLDKSGKLKAVISEIEPKA